MASSALIWELYEEEQGSVKPQRLICGKHRRVPEAPIAKRRSQQRKKRPYPRTLPRGEKPGSCICDYTNYPFLLCERLAVVWETGSSLETEPPKFRFFDLPAEIRLKCYEAMLTMPRAVEFAPEPWYFDGYAPIGRVSREQFADRWEPVKEYHMDTLRALSKAAGVLRTCKKVYEEAKTILYRKNCFSFTNTSGWIGLDWFMFRIGIENCRELRHIVVRHPDFSVLPITLSGSDHFDLSIVLLSRPPLGSPGILYPSRWFEMDISTGPARVLSKIGQLNSLTLVLPFYSPRTLAMDTKGLLAGFPNRSTHKHLRGTLLSFRNDHDPAYGNVQSMAAALVADMERRDPERAGGWRFAESTYDEMGDYQV